MLITWAQDKPSLTLEVTMKTVFYKASDIGALKCQTNNGEKPMAFKTKTGNLRNCPRKAQNNARTQLHFFDLATLSSQSITHWEEGLANVFQFLNKNTAHLATNTCLHSTPPCTCAFDVAKHPYIMFVTKRTQPSVGKKSVEWWTFHALNKQWFVFGLYVIKCCLFACVTAFARWPPWLGGILLHKCRSYY